MSERIAEVVVVGAGFGGIAAAIELGRHGIDDVTLLEAAPAIGGTWYHNDYPGAACDVPSHFYCFSFARRATWSRLCSPRSEILAYLRQVADDFDVTGRVRTNTSVVACTWDARGHWVIQTEGPAGSATLAARVLVLATGQLNQPSFPSIPGLADFAGHTFHSARWDHDYDLTGKRVAVIGTGASAVQFVPEIAPRAGRLSVFQRTGNWLLPRQNRPYPRFVSRAFARFPFTQDVWRALLFARMESLTASIRHPRLVGSLLKLQSVVFMRSQLRDPATRRKAWPDFVFGCKRVLFSSTFLPALQRPDVELVTEAIERMTPAGPQTVDGRVHEVDCIIYGTGFRAGDFMFPMQIIGRDGRHLREEWSSGPHAHLGITAAGFPSMFVMYGPNTNTSGGSIIFFLEAQARYLRQAVQLVRSRNAAMDVRPEVEHASSERLQRRFDGTAWTQCDSWYRNGSGRIVANWPGYMHEYARATATLDPDDFEFVRAPTLAVDGSI